MEHSPSWEGNSSSASQEIRCILWNLKVYHCVQKSSPHLPILSDITRVHAFPSYFLKIYFNIILPSSRRSYTWALSFRFSHHNPVGISHVPRCPLRTPRTHSHRSGIYSSLFHGILFALERCLQGFWWGTVRGRDYLEDVRIGKMECQDKTERGRRLDQCRAVVNAVMNIWVL